MILLPTHLIIPTEEFEVPARDLFIHATAREAARQRLFDRMPWLVGRVTSSVEEYAAGTVISHFIIEGAVCDPDVENIQDLQYIQEAMSGLQNMGLSLRIHSRNENARTHFQTLLALVEGWVDMVVTDVPGERPSDAAQLDEAWHRRHTTENVEQVLEKATGIDFGSPKMCEATNLWHHLTTAVGIGHRDKVWDHLGFLFMVGDLDELVAFTGSVLDSSDSDDFDPIAELEEQLRKKAEKRATEGKDSDIDEDNSGNISDGK